MRTIPLTLLLDLGGTSEVLESLAQAVNPWPGDDFDLDVTTPPTTVDAVWIGVSADGNSSQAYPVDTPLATILGAGWPRIYQGTHIVDSAGNEYVLSTILNDVQGLLANCCGSQVNTLALALKQSNLALTPGETYPCGGEAIFKWLAVRGSTEERVLTARFTIILTSSDNSTVFTREVSTSLEVTKQLVQTWPTTFIDEDYTNQLSETLILVQNGEANNVDEVEVSTFDGGTITVRVEILEGVDVVLSDEKVFALPATDCTDESEESPAPETLDVLVRMGEDFDRPFNGFRIQLWSEDGNTFYGQTALVNSDAPQTITIPNVANVLVRAIVFDANLTGTGGDYFQLGVLFNGETTEDAGDAYRIDVFANYGGEGMTGYGEITFAVMNTIELYPGGFVNP